MGHPVILISIFALGFIEHLDENDTVLADRGFTIEDLVVSKKASLVIPPFMKGKRALSIREEAVTRVIAKARIHIGNLLSLK